MCNLVELLLTLIFQFESVLSLKMVDGCRHDSLVHSPRTSELCSAAIACYKLKTHTQYRIPIFKPGCMLAFNGLNFSIEE